MPLGERQHTALRVRRASQEHAEFLLEQAEEKAVQAWKTTFITRQSDSESNASLRRELAAEREFARRQKLQQQEEYRRALSDQVLEKARRKSQEETRSPATTQIWKVTQSSPARCASDSALPSLRTASCGFHVTEITEEQLLAKRALAKQHSASLLEQQAQKKRTLLLQRNEDVFQEKELLRESRKVHRQEFLEKARHQVETRKELEAHWRVAACVKHIRDARAACFRLEW
eukprot:m.436083 g.436083  ORF g.436083 m.436083 type:complete len:231 (+) comp56765_c0_seq3:72-764(+)